MRISLSSFLQWRMNVYLYQKLGWQIALFYILFLGRLYLFLKKKEKQKMDDALREVFGARAEHSRLESLAAEVCRGTLLHYYEKLFNAFSSDGDLRSFLETRVEDKGLDVIDEGLSRGNGVLLVTGHFGGIEFIPAYLSGRGYPVTIIAKFKSPHLREISLEKAKRFSTEIIDADKTGNMVKAIHDHLKQNRIVITQCDEIEEWRPSKDRKIFFLGKTIHLDRAVNVLLRRCGSCIVFGVMRRTAGDRYQFVVNSWEEMARKYNPESHGAMGGVVLRYMEEYIYANPEQWYQWKKYPEIGNKPIREIWNPVRQVGLLNPSPGIA